MHGSASLALVIGFLPIVLGLGAITASLAPSVEAPGVLAQDRPLVFAAGGGSLGAGLRGPRHDSAQPPAPTLDLAQAHTSAALPPISATGPWKSPLYPQNGVTLWDRIRVSSPQNRPAFLLGTAIQVHAPALAATPMTWTLEPTDRRPRK